MADELSRALQEITGLLRQRIAQSAEASERAQERLARFPIPPAFTPPDFTAMEAKHDADAKVRREEAARQRAEDLAFRERLLEALALHNQLLARLVDQRRPDAG